MERKGVVFLFLIFCAVFLIIAFTIFLYSEKVSEINTITSKASSTQANLYLFIEGGGCGDGICNSTETCLTCSADCGVCVEGGPGGGGGGGGAAVVEKLTIIVDKELFKVETKVGETFKTSFKITNPNTQSVEINLDSTLKDMIIFSENKFSLGPGESKEIFITFYTTKDTEPNVYTGEILVSYGSILKIPVILEVESKKVLFDVTLYIPPKYKELFAGDDLNFYLTLFNLGDVGKVDVKVVYSIKDFEGNVFFTKEDIVAVETQASFLRNVKLPSSLKSGMYAITAQTRYDGSIGTSSDTFTIKESKFISLYKPYLLAFIILIIIIVIIIIVLKREYWKLGKSIRSYRQEIKKASTKIKTEKIENIKTNKIKQELKNKLNILEEAYKEGHISKESFEKGKERIITKYKKLK